jgi:glycosyltransferase involved in cell wall biosynthesis
MSNKHPTSSPKINIGAIRPTGDSESLMLSIIVPVLNEEESIESALNNICEAIEKLVVKCEIIVVDNGSVDSTIEIVERRLRNCDYMKLIPKVLPRGIGVAVWEGIRNSKGRYVVMIPGDGENDTWEILRYLPLMKDVDVVIPYVYNREVRTIFRRLLSKLYKLIINLSFGMLLNYMNGTVMYRRKILDSVDLHSKGFFFQTELLIKCIKCGYLYAEVPYKISPRSGGRQKAINPRSGFILIKEYIELLVAVYWFAGDKANLAIDTASSDRRLESK